MRSEADISNFDWVSRKLRKHGPITYVNREEYFMREPYGREREIKYSLMVGEGIGIQTDNGMDAHAKVPHTHTQFPRSRKRADAAEQATSLVQAKKLEELLMV